MRFHSLVFLLILAVLSLAAAQVSFENCCLTYMDKPSGRLLRHAVKYRRQDLDGGCNIRAIVFTLKRGREYCTDPRKPWVTDLMKKVDMRAELHRKRTQALKKHVHS